MTRILVVEDDEAVRSFTARALKADGHDVATASDGGEGLDSVLAEEFDLVVSDIRMPVMDGIELTHKAAAAHPGLRILLMTGYAEQRERADDLSSKIVDVVSKPFTLPDIRTAVARALAA